MVYDDNINVLCKNTNTIKKKRVSLIEGIKEGVLE